METMGLQTLAFALALDNQSEKEVPFTLVRNDTNRYEMRIEMQVDSTPVVLPPCTARIKFLRSDGRLIVGQAQTDETGLVVYPVDIAQFNQEGVVRAEVSLYPNGADETNKMRMTSQPFRFQVRNDLDDYTSVDADVFVPLFDAVMARCEKAIRTMNDLVTELQKQREEGFFNGLQGPQGIQGPAGAGFEVGDIKECSDQTLEPQWLWCDGGLYSRAEFSELFAVIGERYGAGNGSTTFAVPNITGRTCAVLAKPLPIAQGPQGPRGEQGPQGVQGPKGDPGVGTVRVGKVETVEPGAPAEVVNVGTSQDVVLDFKLPRGQTIPYGTTEGTGNALTLQASGFTLADMQPVLAKLHTDLLDEPSININGTGAKPIYNSDGTKLCAGAKSGAVLQLCYEAGEQRFYVVGGGHSFAVYA